MESRTPRPSHRAARATARRCPPAIRPRCPPPPPLAAPLPNVDGARSDVPLLSPPLQQRDAVSRRSRPRSNCQWLPPGLWAVMLIADRPGRREVRRKLADCLHGVAGHRDANSAAMVAISSTRLTVPTSLLAHITRPEPRRRAAAEPRAGPTAPPTRRIRWATGVISAPSCSGSRATVSSTAWCSTAEVMMRRRLGRRRSRPSRCLRGRVVAVGAARGDDDLRQPRPRRTAGLSRLLQPTAGRARRCAARRVADGCQRRRHRLDGVRVHRGGGCVVGIHRPDLAHGLFRIPGGAVPGAVERSGVSGKASSVRVSNKSRTPCSNAPQP